MRDSLARHIVRDPASPEEMYRLRQRAWLEQGVPSLPLDQLANDWERQTVVNIANRLYGKRRAL